MASEISKVESPNRDLSLLCPWFAARLTDAIQICNDKGYPVKLMEGYRSPARQDWLYAQGRTRPGKVVTRARAWQSWHQFSVAGDLVFWDGRKWFWPASSDALWDRVTAIMEAHGFSNLDFERPHFEIHSGVTLAEAYALVQKSGVQAVWDLIGSRLESSGL